ncbi:LysR family transcriptional regulator [Paraburkholderia hospita]|jgi:DNA-binding transcriptional LysR family regulator|uniref:LysR family transcriptional regulator n=1 Tax=Paraburkholderia hospita TaxID=169430 RepID=A0AAN1JDD2_9BURK|nr:LysR family transcriptional regulator [Paraburkholderia hospita]SOE84535.1 transcriptional regulator, LysR family [Burkholderia sp. YR290]AUT71283.1 LysR family transcriptional regulator [Paraburkholderia hospita]EIM95201.1 LysR family transcriptional regulator [Paraburkholderia hospita]OUL87481.1 LysR family transcriptional regulator [Paraburkholderia hospita]SEI16123.1 transcriptional regulator, LysR family [Paraburkholderia hospita]
MLDGVSLDQLRTFIAAVDEGSFSAAGRSLRRTQSVVSQTLANLEAQTGIQLFDRSGRYPRLTAGGAALVNEARSVMRGMDGFKARARTLAGGLEPELSLAIDAFYPLERLSSVMRAFSVEFPETPLRLYVEALGGATKQILDGICRLGIIGSTLAVPDGLSAEKILDIVMVTVVAPTHPLAAMARVIGMRDLETHVQLVLTDRTDLTEGKNFEVFSPRTWKMADLHAKHEFLRAGFGWGHMPLAMVKDDIASGALHRLRLDKFEPVTPSIPMFAAYRKDTPPGPAGTWFIKALKSDSVLP